MIKLARLRLTTQRNRKCSIVRQSRADIAELLQNDRLDQALARIGKLYKDQNLLAAYDEINDNCECIISNFAQICKQSDVHSLPIDVRQALANLIFAASRCGELPVLHSLRCFFGECYGHEFEIANVELHHGNMVSSQIKENLCKNLVPDDEKLELISEIAKEHSFSGVLGLSTKLQYAMP
ncbi:hypothetical protein I3843_12G120200 [Carya illinoinensis]|nr:hypothetical protein I3843_12G120200 [Carya illinoinensis]